MKGKIIKFCIIIAALIYGFAVCAAAHELVIDTADRTITVDGNTEINISSRVFEYNDTVYAAADDILKACGYITGWSFEYNSIVVENELGEICFYITDNSIKSNDTIYPIQSVVYNDIMYTSISDLEQIIPELKCNIKGHVRNNPKNYRDTLSDTVMTDKYRYSGTVEKVNELGIYAMDNGFAFERVQIEPDRTVEYADAINSIADNAPDDVSVYNMLIPNSCEIYAPADYTTGILDSYRAVYKALDERVIPINVFDTLLDHAYEPIFFKTDHHWTQRGAYYAYEAMMDCMGESVKPLYAYERADAYGFLGSYAAMAKSTVADNLLNDNPEVLERFLPVNNITEDVYTDSGLLQYLGRFETVRTDENSLNYNCFLGGDVPVAILHNTEISNGKTLCILKESYANAFSVWAADNYEYVYLIDMRCFNGVNGNNEKLSLRDFYDLVHYDDLLIMNSPNTVADKWLCKALKLFA